MDSTVENIDTEYNLPLHIAALFINLTASALGVLFPILFLYTSFSPRVSARISSCIQVGKTFGTGVILATAFIHMLPAAFESLTNESLPPIFHEGEGYGAWPGLVTMLAALCMHLIEFAATQRFYQAAQKLSSSSSSSSQPNGNGTRTSYDDNEIKLKHHHLGSDSSSLEDIRTANLVSMQEALDQPFHSHSHGGQIMLQNKKSLAEVETADGDHTHHRHHHNASQGGPEGSHTLGGSSTQEHHAKVISTYILELGIAMHSIIIGVSLGTTTGSAFTSLLVALVFHQFFEGIALGGRIAACGYERSSFKPWLMAFLFAISTPTGVAIGLGIHQTYAEEATTNIIVSGVFDSLSAGILIYTALVQLLTMEMSASTEFRQLPLSKRIVQFVSLWAGAGVMALIGKWA
ncbi:high-affinity Zn(2+) transporter zrt1 [Actinomortierella ambigua]|uniref:High-affinity Zn(2+) transporter zrt1 n=1 Tax=Actinomortierella ambigua TaxID=1343610 RepID=A0A9P6Q7G4_9FUNG|nr:high-affinity Zn(2+) transporter zrt1 [Actinomortierella ambigua]